MLGAAPACSPFLKSRSATFDSSQKRADAGAGSFPLDAYLKAPNPQPSAWFGYAVAVDGDRKGVAVVAPLEDVDSTTGPLVDAGAAYLFEPEGSDWRATPLIAPNARPGDGVLPGEVLPSDIQRTLWGSMRIDMNDDFVVVGVTTEASAKPEDPADDGAPYSGAVYVYDRDALPPSQPQYLKAPNPGKNALFGSGLSLSGARLAVGAAQAGGRGAVYVYSQEAGKRAFGSPPAVVDLQAIPGSLFGAAVALRGDLMVVGAPGEDTRTPSDAGKTSTATKLNTGAAYVYRFLDGTWRFESRIPLGRSAEESFFGFSVAVADDGHTIAVGSPSIPACNADEASAPFRGAVFLASDEAIPGTWPIVSCLGPAFVRGDAFGWSAQFSGDLLLVGAPWDISGTSDPSNTSKPVSGAAYLYEHATQPLEQPPAELKYFKAPNPDQNDVFGNGVSIANGLVAIGAPREWGGQTGPSADPSDNSVMEAGAVYVFSVPNP